jgi:hypothetical protein
MQMRHTRVRHGHVVIPDWTILLSRMVLMSAGIGHSMTVAFWRGGCRRTCTFVVAISRCGSRQGTIVHVGCLRPRRVVICAMLTRADRHLFRTMSVTGLMWILVVPNGSAIALTTGIKLGGMIRWWWQTIRGVLLSPFLDFVLESAVATKERQ